MDSFVQRKLEPDLSLDEEVARNWAEILNQFYQFDRLLKEVCEGDACGWCVGCEVVMTTDDYVWV